jgi:hypothetical protein
MGIGEQFEFEKTGRIGPDPLSAFALQEIGKLRRQYTELACAVWCCPKEEFDGDHNSVVAEADRQAMLVVKQADEIERLRAIVDALPKTEDGKEIVPGIELWATGEILYSNGAVMLVKAHRCTAEMDTSFHSQFVGKFYSTREAATAAGG